MLIITKYAKIILIYEVKMKKINASLKKFFRIGKGEDVRVLRSLMGKLKTGLVHISPMDITQQFTKVLSKMGRPLL